MPDKPVMAASFHVTLSDNTSGAFDANALVAGLQLKNKRLLIVADGALHYIPFAALPAPPTSSSANGSASSSAAPPVFVPLAATHEVLNLPSASALMVLRRETSGEKVWPKAAAVFADPVFDKEDDRVRGAAGRRSAKLESSREAGSGEAVIGPLDLNRELVQATRDVGIANERGFLTRLHLTRREAKAISDVAGAGQVLTALDFDAGRAAIGIVRDQYRIVHYATHGLLDVEHPELSGIVLSLVDRDGNPQNGFFRLLDIYNLPLNTDLVVLSACQTALGKKVSGEGLIGITRGFMYAGARRVVSSLWNVDDQATAELIKRFYEAMLKEGKKPAAALRSAQISLWKQKRWTSPYYWAAFTLQGEWN